MSIVLSGPHSLPFGGAEQILEYISKSVFCPSERLRFWGFLVYKRLTTTE